MMDGMFKPFIETKRVGSRVLQVIPVEVVDRHFLNKRVVRRVVCDLFVDDPFMRGKFIEALGLDDEF